jgi:hypothetical protein
MTQQTSVDQHIIEIEVKTAPTCRHYWVIQPATGPVSQGACQNCGETREFKNYVEASTWGDDKGANRTPAVVPAVAETLADEEVEE